MPRLQWQKRLRPPGPGSRVRCAWVVVLSWGRGRTLQRGDRRAASHDRHLSASPTAARTHDLRDGVHARQRSTLLAPACQPQQRHAEHRRQRAQPQRNGQQVGPVHPVAHVGQGRLGERGHAEEQRHRHQRAQQQRLAHLACPQAAARGHEQGHPHGKQQRQQGPDAQGDFIDDVHCQPDFVHGVSPFNSWSDATRGRLQSHFRSFSVVAQAAEPAPRPGLPRKGRQYSHVRALGASPCPHCAAMRERGEGPQGLSNVLLIPGL